MNALYWFALVVGVGMFLVSLAADFLGDADIHVDADADADIDLDHGDIDHDADHGASGFRILSVRNATYFLFAFGVTGVVLTLLWGGSHTLLTAVLATMLGLVGGAISTTMFGWMKRTESGEIMDDRGWVGLTGEVTLPLMVGGTGKIEVERGGRHHELLARPFDAEPDRPEAWTRVLVIEMRHGVALVGPPDPALDNGESLRIAPGTES
jgi:hypothetical protein